MARHFFNYAFRDKNSPLLIGVINIIFSQTKEKLLHKEMFITDLVHQSFNGLQAIKLTLDKLILCYCSKAVLSMPLFRPGFTKKTQSNIDVDLCRKAAKFTGMGIYNAKRGKVPSVQLKQKNIGISP